MKILLDELNEIKNELTDLSQKAQTYFKSGDIGNGKVLLTAYKACAIKLRKKLLDNGFGNSEYFSNFTNVFVTDMLKPIDPITNPRRIQLLKEQIDSDIFYLGEDIGYVEECLEIDLPINRDLNLNGSLLEEEYEKIIRNIYKYGTFMSGTRDTHKGLGENALRDILLNNLNSIYPNLIGTGETFNKAGHADIILKNIEKTNVFIAECKLWKNPKYAINDALDQLLDNYVTEYDNKISLIIFNNKVKITTAKDGIENLVIPHLKSRNLNPKYMPTQFPNTKYVYYYEIDNPVDSSETVELTVILININ
ncbi:hypothetical protein ACFW1D_19415 [Priestia megaterium]|uniref:hypothetical protein n=1 Tax=Priestia megaterium TaxID=1404 RepID=UPI0036716DBB